MYSTVTRSPTRIWSKFLASGGTTTSTILPLAPLSVAVRVAASSATTVAVTLTAPATPPLPGALAAMTAATGGLACCAKATGLKAAASARLRTMRCFMGTLGC